MTDVRVGFEAHTGKEIRLELSHLVITGLTQHAGKTTTLEALAERATKVGQSVIVFNTKPGENSFRDANRVLPFFRNRSDYEFIKSLIEAYNREKLFLERGTLMGLCKGTASLADIFGRVKLALEGGKLRGLAVEIYTRLEHYLGNLIQQVEKLQSTPVLQFKKGAVNVMDLRGLTEEVQSLIIQATAHEVLTNHTHIIVGVPEAWKFIPQKYNNPCKREIESFIRQGAVNRNFIWIDSQDMSGVDKLPLKSVQTWMLGLQTERNEVEHTIDQIPAPKSKRPKPDEVMQLKIGHFYVCTPTMVAKTYVQPLGLDDEAAIARAKGAAYGKMPAKPQEPKEQGEDPAMIAELERKVADLERKLREKEEILRVHDAAAQKDHADVQAARGLRLALSNFLGGPVANAQSVDVESIVNVVLSRLPASGAMVSVVPLDALKKRFMEEEKGRILAGIRELKPDEQKSLLFVLAQAKGVNHTILATKGLGLASGQGGNGQKVKEIRIKLAEEGWVRYDSAHGVMFPNVYKRIEADLTVHGATPEEIDAVYNHVLAEMAK